MRGARGLEAEEEAGELAGLVFQSGRIQLGQLRWLERLLRVTEAPHLPTSRYFLRSRAIELQSGHLMTGLPCPGYNAAHH